MRRNFLFYTTVMVCLFAFTPNLLLAEQGKEQLDLQSAKEMMINVGIEPTLAEIYTAFASGKKEALPESYFSMTGGFCGTSVITRLKHDWEKIPSQLQLLLKPLLDRPVNQAFIDFTNPIPSEREGMGIRVHYDTSGPLSVSYSVASACGANAVTALFLKYTHIGMGYRSPSADGGRGGVRGNGADQYDIYLNNPSNPTFTAETHPEDSGASYIIIHPSYATWSTIIAHELFHSVQIAYTNQFPLWWGELTANWGAFQVFPDSEIEISWSARDYFFPYPETSLVSASPGAHAYGAYVWAVYLGQKFGTGIIKNQIEIYERNQPGFPSDNAMLAATDTSLLNRGSNLVNAYKEFTIWNYFTGYRYNRGVVGLRYYPPAQANTYGEVPLVPIQSYPRQDTFGTISYLGAKYVRYDTIGCCLHTPFDLTHYSLPPPPLLPCSTCAQAPPCIFDTIACCPPEVPSCDLDHRCPRWKRAFDEDSCPCTDCPPITTSFSPSGRWRNSLLVFRMSGSFDTVFVPFDGDTGQISANINGEFRNIVSIPINVQPIKKRPVMTATYARPRGDMNNDFYMTTSDLIRLMNWVSHCTSPPPTGLPEMADVNCDGIVNGDDSDYMLNYIYFGEPVPCDLTDNPCCPSPPSSCPP